MKYDSLFPNLQATSFSIGGQRDKLENQDVVLPTYPLLGRCKVEDQIKQYTTTSGGLAEFASK